LLEYYGKAVARIINILDPEVIVIGGGLSKIDRLYSEGKEYIVKYLFNKDLNTKIIRPKLGDSAGVIGAGLLTPH